MNRPYIVYIQDKTSPEFKFRADVLSAHPTDNGYRITFNNNRSYNYGAARVKCFAKTDTKENVRIYENGVLNKSYDTVNYYGDILIFRKGSFCSPPIENSAHIEISKSKQDIKKEIATLDYFKEILNQSLKTSFDTPSEEEEKKNINQLSSELLLKALHNIDLEDSRSVLSKYINGENPPIERTEISLIYPFGCNESQKLAVETALKNSISIIEGPPGTGKTQTILNIIANLILQNKTVAITSNNNSAVENVQEKLEKYGYGMLVASLGNNNNKDAFFRARTASAIDKTHQLTREELSIAKQKLNSLEGIVSQNFNYRNRLATAKTELEDAKIEFTHLKQEQPLDHEVKANLDKKFHTKWTIQKVLKINEYLSRVLMSNLKPSLLQRIKVAFKLWDIQP